MSKINEIKLSGTSYDIEDLNAPKTVSLTQAQYDALVTKDENTFYVITDAQPGDLTQYWTSAQTQSAINQATSGKQDTLSAGTGIDITDNVISATGGGGGGKAIEAGRGIAVTTGATADTVSVSIPISAGTGTNSLTFGYDDVSLPQSISKAIGKYSIAGGIGCSALTEDSVALGYLNKAAGSVSYGNFAQGYMTTASGNRCHSEGLGTSSTADASHSEGHNTVASGNYSHSEGEEVNATNQCEHSQGRYNVSNKANTTWGDSGNTLFSVGNGTSASARHNAFEIRQNGDIYLSSGGTDIKLQDHLGGGGGSITIDPSLDSGSTNAVANSAITNAFTAVNDNINELSANSVTNCSNVDIVDAPATPPSTIENDYVKVSWEDDYTQTYAVDYNGNIGDGDTHYGSNITKVEFGSSGFEIYTFNFGFGNDDCYGLKTAIFNGDVNLENITFSSAYQLEGVYFYALSPSGITGVDEHFLSRVYDGCQTYEETDATYPIYVADLAAYSGAVLCYSYDLERNITWSEHFGNRLQEIPSGKKFVYNDFVTYSAATDAALSGKQDTLSAGTGISISGNVISATGGGGGSCTVNNTIIYDTYADSFNGETTYVIMDYTGDKTQATSINYYFIIQNNSNYYVNQWIYFNYVNGTYELSNQSEAGYIDITYDSTIEDFIISVATSIQSVAHISAVNSPIGTYIKVPFYEIESGSPCTVIENDITEIITQTRDDILNSVGNVGFSLNSNQLSLYYTKNNDTQVHPDTIYFGDDFDANNGTIRTNIRIPLGVSGWTNVVTDEQGDCSIGLFETTKFRVTYDYDPSTVDYGNLSLYYNIIISTEGFRTESQDSINFNSETGLPQLVSSYFSTAATLTWSASTKELIVEYPSSMYIEDLGGTYNLMLSSIGTYNCHIGSNDIIKKIEKYEEIKQPIIPYVQETKQSLGGLSLVKLTQTQYDNLSSYDSNTLYVIVN